MLFLDHVGNDGAERRRKGEKGGWALYCRLFSEGLPDIGLQTMCFNHQMKKVILSNREKRKGDEAQCIVRNVCEHENIP
jgi:hypothetical protein